MEKPEHAAQADTGLGAALDALKDQEYKKRYYLSKLSDEVAHLLMFVCLMGAPLAARGDQAGGRVTASRTAPARVQQQVPAARRSDGNDGH